MGGTVIREFDAGRQIEIEAKDGLVFIEVEGACLAFDRLIFLHGLRKVLQIKCVLQDLPREELVPL